MRRYNKAIWQVTDEISASHTTFALPAKPTGEEAI